MQGAIHASPSSIPLTIVERLAYRIDEIRHAQARACIVWLVGQYAADDSPNAVVEGVVPWAPDVFRKIAKSFRDEARGRTFHFRSVELAHTFPPSIFFSLFLVGQRYFFILQIFFSVQTVPVKLQAVTLAAKLLVLSPTNGTLIQLAKYVFALARYDCNYDVRDRGRMLQQLLVGVVPNMAATDAQDVGGVVLRRAQVRVVLFEGKAIASPSSSRAAAHHDHDAARRGRDHDLGTLGLVLGRDVPNARLLPDWLEHGVESSLRYVPDDALPSSSAASAVTAIGHVASSSLRAGTGGHSTPIVVLTPGGSSGGPSPAGSVPNKAGWTDLDAFYASESEEEEEESEDEESEEEESEKGEEEEEEEEEDEDEDGEEEGGKSGEESDRQSGEEKHEVRRAGLLRASDKEDGTGSDVEGASSQIAAVSVR
jgi:AP-3 complex subunit beta